MTEDWGLEHGHPGHWASMGTQDTGRAWASETPSMGILDSGCLGHPGLRASGVLDRGILDCGDHGHPRYWGSGVSIMGHPRHQ